MLEWMKSDPESTAAVEGLLSEAEGGAAKLYMSAINVGEVYYFVRKQYSEALAETWRRYSTTLPISIEVPTADEIWDAALIKSRFPISYADAFAAALAQKYDCPLITGDSEFRSVLELQLEWTGPATI